MKDEVRATTEQGKRMLHRVYDYNVEYMTTKDRKSTRLNSSHDN